MVWSVRGVPTTMAPSRTADGDTGTSTPSIPPRPRCSSAVMIRPVAVVDDETMARRRWR